MTTALLDTHAAADRTGLARQTLAKLRTLGGGPPFRKIGAKVLYPEDKLDAWIESRPLRVATSASEVAAPSRQAASGDPALVRFLADAMCNVAMREHHEATGEEIGCPKGSQYRGIAGRNGVACDWHQAHAAKVLDEMAAIRVNLARNGLSDSSLPANT